MVREQKGVIIVIIQQLNLQLCPNVMDTLSRPYSRALSDCNKTRLEETAKLNYHCINCNETMNNDVLVSHKGSR